MKRKPQLKPGVFIDRYELDWIVGKEILVSALNELEEKLKHSSLQNLYWEKPTANFNIEIGYIKLVFPTIEESKKIARFFKKSINKYRSRLTKMQIENLKNNDYFIYVIKFCQCPVCREWEDYEGFTFNHSLNLFKCNQWEDCDNYDDYYKDE
jgi:hypothetical protein